MSVGIVGGGVPAAGSSYLFHETLEGSSACYTGDVTYVNCNQTGWTLGSNIFPIFNNSTSGLSLQGSYAMKFLLGASHTARNSFTGQDAITYFSFMVRCTGTITDSFDIYVENNGSGFAMFRILYVNATDMYPVLYYNGVGTYGYVGGYGNIIMKADETWYVKIAYTKGTGNNGVWDVYMSKTTTWPATQLHVTNATDSVQFNGIAFIGPSSVQTTYVDDIRVSTSDITY